MRKVLAAVTALGLLAASVPAVAETTPSQPAQVGAVKKTATVKKHKHYAKRHHGRHLAKAHKRHHVASLHKRHKLAAHKRHQVRLHKKHKVVAQKS